MCCVRLPRVLRTASFKLIALYALLFALSVAALGGFVFFMTRSALESQMAARISAEVASLQAEGRDSGLDQLAKVINGRQRGLSALDYALIGPDGTRRAGDLPEPNSRRGWIEIQSYEMPNDEDGPETLMALVVALPDGSVLAVGDDLGRITEVEEAVLSAFGWALGGTVLLGLVGGLVLSAGFLRRLDSVTRTAEAIMDGNLALRVPVRGTDDDFDRLASALNRMLDRIGTLLDSLQQVSSDIAHDLRMPLSHLRQRLEITRLSAATLQDYEVAVDAAIEETNSILDTFSAILRIAQIEAGTRRAGFKEVSLGAIATSVVEAFAPSAEEQGKALVAAMPDRGEVRGDQELLTQMMANLVENAIRHTPAGTKIGVEVKDRPSGVTLTVADDGPGVPEEQRPFIFRRFYRLERSRATPGNGLGLSLVAAVAELHGATIGIEDNGPGLRMTIDFSDPHRARHE